MAKKAKKTKGRTGKTSPAAITRSLKMGNTKKQSFRGANAQAGGRKG